MAFENLLILRAHFVAGVLKLDLADTDQNKEIPGVPVALEALSSDAQYAAALLTAELVATARQQLVAGDPVQAAADALRRKQDLDAQISEREARVRELDATIVVKAGELAKLLPTEAPPPGDDSRDDSRARVE